MQTSVLLNGAEPTDFRTFAATYTELRKITKLTAFFEGFGIVTPKASVITAFQEYRRPDSGAVVSRKLVYIENRSAHKNRPVILLKH